MIRQNCPVLCNVVIPTTPLKVIIIKSITHDIRFKSIIVSHLLHHLIILVFLTLTHLQLLNQYEMII